MTKEPKKVEGAVVLGGCYLVASWRRLDDNKSEPYMNIMSMGSGVAVVGRDALIALRAAIDEALGCKELE